MRKKRITSLLAATVLLVGVILTAAFAANRAVVQVGDYDITLGIGEVSIISAKLSDDSDCKINFVSKHGNVTIGETVYNKITHVSYAAVKGAAAGQDMILAVAEGNYANGVCIAAVGETVADGQSINQTEKAGTASSSGSSPASEMPPKAFDKNTRTKWLIFDNNGWLQYRFNDGKRYSVNAYMIASANDVEERDPSEWELLGSNDGAIWTVLDTRANENFEKRYQERTFYFNNTEAYEYYRLNVLKNSSDVNTQISEFRLLEYGDNEVGTKTELNALIEKAALINFDSLTAQSAVMLSDTLSYATGVNNKANASQGKIDAAVSAMDKMLAAIESNSTYYIKTDKDEYVVNDTVSIEVATTTDISAVSLKDEKGQEINLTSSSYKDEGDIRYWTLTAVFTSNGKYVVSAAVKNAEGQTIDVTNINTTITVKSSDAEPQLIKAKRITDSPVKVNEKIVVQVTTSTSVNEVSVMNENGDYFNSSSKYNDDGDIRTWNVSFTADKAGNTDITVWAKSGDKMLEYNLNLSVTVVE